MNFTKEKEKNVETNEATKKPAKNSVWGCMGFILLILFGIFLLAFFFVGPNFLKEFLFNTEDALAFSTQYKVTILVMIFFILCFFPCLYFIKSIKLFLLLMTVPFLAWVMLFFNYYLVTFDGVKANPYLQVIPKFIEWEEMEEVAFIPSYYVARRETNFEIKIACLIDGKSHWIETHNDLVKLQKLKEMLANQGNVPVFIYPLDEGDINRLEEYKEDDKDYYNDILRFLEVKDINNYKEEHILVNESFYE